MKLEHVPFVATCPEVSTYLELRRRCVAQYRMATLLDFGSGLCHYVGLDYRQRALRTWLVALLQLRTKGVTLLLAPAEREQLWIVPEGFRFFS